MANITHQKHLTAAVTGAGSGLGRDIALALAAKNYRVFGTALSPQEIDDLKQASDGAVSLSQCDITDEAAVRNWVIEVVARTGGGLDLLISNAGVLTPGPLEALPLSAIRREFEVNVFGVLAVVNAFLPALRKQRGRIETEDIKQLQQLLAVETSGQQLILDLRDVTLVNQDAVKFLRRCEADGIKLENCPLSLSEGGSIK